MAGTVRPTEEPMKRVQHTLTSNELLHLKASPVTILPSPGPNKFYAVFCMISYFHHGTTPYDLNTNGYIITTGEPFMNGYITIGGMLSEAVDGLSTGSMGYANALASLHVDQPLALTVDGSAELLAGDGTLLTIIYYSIESTT
jgi:hypothetical protein